MASVIRRESSQPKARPDARAQASIDLATFVRALGVPDLPLRTSAFDTGYDPAAVESHLVQSGRLITRLKLSMATEAKKGDSTSFGYRPFTLLGRRILPRAIGLRVNSRLQDLSDGGLTPLSALGAQYLGLARKATGP